MLKIYGVHRSRATVLKSWTNARAKRSTSMAPGPSCSSSRRTLWQLPDVDMPVEPTAGRNHGARDGESMIDFEIIDNEPPAQRRVGRAPVGALDVDAAQARCTHPVRDRDEWDLRVEVFCGGWCVGHGAQRGWADEGGQAFSKVSSHPSTARAVTCGCSKGYR